MSNNNKKQLELLNKEVNWWRDVLNTQPKDTKLYNDLLSPKNSFLCSMYNNENLLLNRDCKDCPVYNYTGLQYCEGTPYVNIINIHTELLSIQDKISDTEDKTEKQLLLKELDGIELKLYQSGCKYWRFLKYQVLPYVVNKQEKD